MFNSREIVAAKFWKQSRTIRQEYRGSEGDFDNILLTILAINIIADLSLNDDINPSHIAEIARKTKSEIINSSRTNDRRNSIDNINRFVIRFIQELPGPGHEIINIHTLGDEFFYIQESIERIHNEYDQSYTLHIADYVFYKIAHREDPSVIQEASNHLASFALDLNFDNGPITEYFGKTGEIFTFASKTSTQQSIHAQVAHACKYSFALSLRMAIYGIRLDKIENDRHYFDQRLGLVIIDHIGQKGDGLIRPTQHRDDSTTVKAIYHLLRNAHHFEKIIALVSETENKSQTKFIRELRGKLIRDQRILAVIKIPRVKNQKSTTIWVIQRSGHIERRKVLFIDAKIIARASENDHLDALRLASRIINIWESDIGFASNAQRFENQLSDKTEDIYSRHFAQGYRDIQGLCQEIPVDAIAANDYDLTVGKYIQANENSTWLRYLDSSEIINSLRSESKNNCRIYVIGNNGEGKSLLLRELAEELGRLQIPTFGISFGLTDRFHFDKHQCEEINFTYLGARTGKQNVALSSTNTLLADLMQVIHTDPRKLSALNQVMDLLGFESRRFLVPTGISFNKFDHQDQFDDVIELALDAESNKERLSNSFNKKYKIGLIRENGNEDITLFDELSSGEQQLLLLACKLIAKNKEGAVLLIDEPELSLHVSWQRSIPKMLKIISEAMACSMVIATHSPIIVASTDTDNDQCFAAHQRSLKRLIHRKLHSVETALFEGFQTYTVNNRHIHERCAELISEIIKTDSASPDDLSTNKITSYLNELIEMSTLVSKAKRSGDFDNIGDDLELIEQSQNAIRSLFLENHGVSHEKIKNTN